MTRSKPRLPALPAHCLDTRAVRKTESPANTTVSKRKEGKGGQSRARRRSERLDGLTRRHVDSHREGSSCNDDSQEAESEKLGRKEEEVSPNQDARKKKEERTPSTRARYLRR